jgi:predicted RNA-binding Zn-ribbon protein involved in translation (DUF1610 family)
MKRSQPPESRGQPNEHGLDASLTESTADCSLGPDELRAAIQGDLRRMLRETGSVDCPRCGWSGPGSETTQEETIGGGAGRVELNCPRCGQPLKDLFVNY